MSLRRSHEGQSCLYRLHFFSDGHSGRFSYKHGFLMQEVRRAAKLLHSALGSNVQTGRFSDRKHELAPIDLEFERYD